MASSMLQTSFPATPHQGGECVRGHANYERCCARNEENQEQGAWAVSNQHGHGVLDEGLERLQQLGAERAVDHPVID